MAESDESGRSRAMPPPELNPLLNPTLNKHLSRWAEVYFKSSPENRDEAVRELLRELEAGNSHAVTNASDLTSRFDEPPTNGMHTSSAPVQNSECQSCGFVTRPNQKFCGRCGARLVPQPRPVESRPEVEQGWEDQTRRVSPPEPAEHMSIPTAAHWTPAETLEPSREEASEEPPWMFQEEEPAPFWYSYRFYIGAAFAILVLVLGYLAWQGTKTSPQAAKLPEQAPATQVPQSTTTPASSTTNQPSSSPVASPAPQASQETATANSSQPQTPVQSQPRPPIEAPAAGQSGNASTEVPPAASLNGTSELTTARQFLDSPHPDNAQAAEWLWKSVAKQNTEATLLLARLYLRGEGVQKNCEQGHVLLDAAAKKGNKEAASMLQNLQAFGCQ
ncbi:MAG TPA: hypothetical protein VKV39_03290 [Candidatus Sulfotelmatobacter sp.]|nr:hypothetical protein [Candidatus Sulfotelmatobacter sp.]